MIKQAIAVTTAILLAGCVQTESINVSAKEVPYKDLIVQEAGKQGVDSKLIKAVIKVESRFNSNVTGRSGEIGLMQIKLATAKGIGYTGSRKDLYDPKQNIKYGVKYLKLALDSSNNTCEALMKYNQGLHAKKYTKQARNYCNKVLSSI